jgi:hypothetical protein
MALLATACGSGSGDQTQCSAWISMDNADQRSTITSMYQQDGRSNPGNDEVSQLQRAASYYCANPFPNISTISGMYASRPGT